MALKSAIITPTEKQFATFVTLGTHLKARLNWLVRTEDGTLILQNAKVTIIVVYFPNSFCYLEIWACFINCLVQGPEFLESLCSDDPGNRSALCISQFHLPPAPSPPPPGYCGAFARLKLVSPGGGAFANPRASPKLFTRTRFPFRIELHRRFYLKKKADWLICQGQE